MCFCFGGSKFIYSSTLSKPSLYPTFTFTSSSSLPLWVEAVSIEAAVQLLMLMLNLAVCLCNEGLILSDGYVWLRCVVEEVDGGFRGKLSSPRSAKWVIPYIVRCTDICHTKTTVRIGGIEPHHQPHIDTRQARLG